MSNAHDLVQTTHNNTAHGKVHDLKLWCPGASLSRAQKQNTRKTSLLNCSAPHEIQRARPKRRRANLLSGVWSILDERRSGACCVAGEEGGEEDEEDSESPPPPRCWPGDVTVGAGATVADGEGGACRRRVLVGVRGVGGDRVLADRLPPREEEEDEEDEEDEDEEAGAMSTSPEGAGRSSSSSTGWQRREVSPSPSRMRQSSVIAGAIRLLSSFGDASRGSMKRHVGQVDASVSHRSVHSAWPTWQAEHAMKRTSSPSAKDSRQKGHADSPSAPHSRAAAAAVSVSRGSALTTASFAGPPFGNGCSSAALLPSCAWRRTRVEARMRQSAERSACTLPPGQLIHGDVVRSAKSSCRWM